MFPAYFSIKISPKFLQLKQTKLSEVVIQCDLPYDETNFDLEFEEEMFETLEFNDNLAIMDDLIQTVRQSYT